MGLWDKIKSVFSKKEQPKLLPEGNENRRRPTEEEIEANYQREMSDLKRELERTEQENKAYESYMNELSGRMSSLNSAPGARHIAQIQSEQAKEVLEDFDKMKRMRNRAAYINENKYARTMDNLLKYLKHQENLEKLGIAQEGKYSGDYDTVLAEYNYEQLGKRSEKLKVNRQKCFIPYLIELEEAGGEYDLNDLPTGVRAVYEAFKVANAEQQTKGIMSGLVMSDILGVCKLEESQLFKDIGLNGQKICRENVALVSVITAKTLPKEYEKCVKEPDNSKRKEGP